MIVGGGFGGLAAARGARAGAACDVTLVDRSNHHLFQPLLYQVATAGLVAGRHRLPDPRASCAASANARVLLGEVMAIDPAGEARPPRRTGELGYDYLILATGARHSYFGHDEWEPHAPGLKTLEDALEIRRRVLRRLRGGRARGRPPRPRRQWLTFVVVGGGPTGVELAGALAEIARHTLARDFRRIDPRTARVILVEAGPRVLPAYPEELSEQGAAPARGARRAGLDRRAP